MLALALTLALHVTPRADYGASGGVEGIVSRVFRSNEEATDFSAHVAWSLVVPLAGHAVAGRRGALIAGGGWVAYTLVNELVLHGPEAGRERALNLTARLIPCAAVMIWELLRR